MRAVLSAMLVLLAASVSVAEPVAVRHPAVPAQVRLVLRSLAGERLADGEWTEAPAEDRATARLAFHFRDGSLYDETTIFSDRGHFHLISDRVVEHGPSFPQPIDVLIDVAAQQVTVMSVDGRGHEKHDVARLRLADDLANGLLPTLLENVRDGGAVPTFPYVAATPKPRLVTLAVRSAADEATAAGQTARHYVLKVEIGGVAGLLAPLAGRQPPDVHMWIALGEMPAFLQSEQPLYVGGPVWRIEVARGSS